MRLTFCAPIVIATCFIVLSHLPGQSLTNDEGKKVSTLVSWGGKAKLETRKQAPEAGYVADEETWKELWNAWRGTEKAPWVNFRETVVVIAANHDPNGMGVECTVDDNGDLKVRRSSTLIAFPKPTEFSYMFALIRRAGIKTIDGEKID